MPEKLNIADKLAEIRAHVKPGTYVTVATEREGQLIQDLVFLLALIDADSFDFFCHGCRRAFASIDELTGHDGCRFWVEVEEKPDAVR